MESNSQNSKRTTSSVELLRSHIDNMSIRDLDDDWIKKHTVDLGSLMEDGDQGIGFKYGAGMGKRR